MFDVVNINYYVNLMQWYWMSPNHSISDDIDLSLTLIVGQRNKWNLCEFCEELGEFS